MKDLKLCDRHVNDMVKDELGRPFRKYSHNQLSQLERSVQAWNRRKQHSREQSKWQTRVKPRINVEPTKETRSKGQVAAARIAQAIARVDPEGSWKARFLEAETNDDRGVFANLVKSKVQEIQDFLLRSQLKVESAFPNFHSLIRAKWREDVGFAHRWKTLWARRRRGLKKPSTRQGTYVVPPVPGPPLPPLPPTEPKARGPPLVTFKKSDLWSIPDEHGRISALAVCKQQARGKQRKTKVKTTRRNSTMPRDSHLTQTSGDPLGWMSRPRVGKGLSSTVRTGQKDEPAENKVESHRLKSRPTMGKGQRPPPKPPWKVDPTPPWLKQPLAFKVESFTEAPLELNPDLYMELRNKAVQRWTRPFSAHAMGGHSRFLYHERDLKDTPMWKRASAVAGQAVLAVPGPQTVRKLCQSLLKAQHAHASTSALLLIPEDMMNMKAVKEFLHAYCLKGETFRGGPLFKRKGADHWLHLNQAVHEFWFDAMKPSLPHLNEQEQNELNDFIEEFEDCIGDSNTSNVRRQSASSGQIPYVRLPVKVDYVRSSDPPFKKIPKTRQLTIDFVRDMERRGLVSRWLY